MSFNQAQQEAVSHNEGPCLVLAGPGSGKTLTIVGRIQKLIQTYHVSPEEILVITFTKYAAVEMKNRFFSAMKGTRPAVTFGTFHGIYYGILKWAYRFGPENILSEEEKRQMLLQIVNRKEIDEFEEEDFLKEIISEIGIVKNNGLKIEEYETTICGKETFREIYREYERKRNEERKIDFDDMLLLCRDLFIKRPDILKKWQEKFRYILIDEFQDINQVQYDVIRMLAAPENNLFVVGDDDQSIYAFRGAKPEIMLHFPEDYPDAKTELLACNYRSASTIVELSQKVISKNLRRYKKELFADKMGGKPVTIQVFEDGKQEELYVKSQVKELLKKGIPYEEMAVLYRTNSGARFLVETLMQYQIPFCMRDTLPNLYEHWIAQDVISYIRIAMGERSRREFLRIMNRPNRYFSRDALDDAQVSFEGLRWFYEEKDWMCDRIDKLEEDLNTLKRMTPYGAINYIRYGIGYEEYLKEYAGYRKIKAEELFEVMEELASSAKNFKSFSEWFVHIEEYTQQLKEQAKKQVSEKKGITISTLHSIKGLEFDAVFLMDVNEGSLPYHKAVTESSIEEERRLFYVGITRARKFLWILYAKNRHEKELEVSRFLTESGLVLKEEKDKKK